MENGCITEVTETTNIRSTRQRNRVPSVSFARHRASPASDSRAFSDANLFAGPPGVENAENECRVCRNGVAEIEVFPNGVWERGGTKEGRRFVALRLAAPAPVGPAGSAGRRTWKRATTLNGFEPKGPSPDGFSVPRSRPAQRAGPTLERCAPQGDETLPLPHSSNQQPLSSLRLLRTFCFRRGAVHFRGPSR